jgi:CheY-like chemotaxis protein
MTEVGPTAVVADDDAVIRRLLTQLLRREGFTVHSAADGGHAVALVREVHPLVVFLDALMPVADGYTACRRIRSELDPAAQPVIVMVTGAGQGEDRELATAAGVDAFITKPFSPSRLSAQVREILRGSA